MKKQLNHIKDFLLNPFHIKVFFILMPLLLEVSVLIPILNSYLKLGLLWAAIFLLYDLFHERNILNFKYSKLLWSFLFTYFISILLNRHIQLKMNLIGYSYIIVTFLVLLLPSKENNEVKELKTLNMIIIRITSVASLIGIFLFSVQYFGEFEYLNGLYRIGFHANRLIGVYRGVTTPTTAIGIMIPIIHIAIIRNEENPEYFWPITGFISNSVHTGLSNSKGIFIGLYVFLFVLVFFLNYSKFLNKGYFKAIGISVITGLIVILAFNQGLKLSNKTMSFVPAEVSQIYHMVGEDGDDSNLITDPIDLDREVPGNYDVFTGRPFIWKLGLERFAKKPIFGYGAFTTAKTITLPFSQQSFSTYHNFYIHTLVSAGIVGAIPLFAYLLLHIFNVLKYLFVAKRRNSTYIIITAISAMLAFYLITNLAETTMLYMNKFSEFTFWIYLGYTVQLLERENKEEEVVFND